jgi:hypothetical protein
MGATAIKCKDPGCSPLALDTGLESPEWRSCHAGAGDMESLSATCIVVLGVNHLLLVIVSRIHATCDGSFQPV